MKDSLRTCDSCVDKGEWGPEIALLGCVLKSEFWISPSDSSVLVSLWSSALVWYINDALKLFYMARTVCNSVSQRHGFQQDLDAFRMFWKHKSYFSPSYRNFM